MSRGPGKTMSLAHAALVELARPRRTEMEDGSYEMLDAARSAGIAAAVYGTKPTPAQLSATRRALHRLADAGYIWLDYEGRDLIAVAIPADFTP